MWSYYSDQSSNYNAEEKDNRRVGAAEEVAPEFAVAPKIFSTPNAALAKIKELAAAFERELETESRKERSSESIQTISMLDLSLAQLRRVEYNIDSECPSMNQSYEKFGAYGEQLYDSHSLPKKNTLDPRFVAFFEDLQGKPLYSSVASKFQAAPQKQLVTVLDARNEIETLKYNVQNPSVQKRAAIQYQRMWGGYYCTEGTKLKALDAVLAVLKIYPPGVLLSELDELVPTLNQLSAEFPDLQKSTGMRELWTLLGASVAGASSAAAAAAASPEAESAAATEAGVLASLFNYLPGR